MPSRISRICFSAGSIIAEWKGADTFRESNFHRDGKPSIISGLKSDLIQSKVFDFRWDDNLSRSIEVRSRKEDQWKIVEQRLDIVAEPEKHQAPSQQPCLLALQARPLALIGHVPELQKERRKLECTWNDHGCIFTNGVSCCSLGPGSQIHFATIAVATDTKSKQQGCVFAVKARSWSDPGSKFCHILSQNFTGPLQSSVLRQKNYHRDIAPIPGCWLPCPGKDFLEFMNPQRYQCRSCFLLQPRLTIELNPLEFSRYCSFFKDKPFHEKWFCHGF